MRTNQLLALLLLVLLGCSSHKTSPAELVAALEKQGLNVEKDGSYSNQPGWEMNLKLKLDGEEGYTAIRFPSVELARDACQAKKNGIALDYWCVDAWDQLAKSPAWTKAKRIAQK